MPIPLANALLSAVGRVAEVGISCPRPTLDPWQAVRELDPWKPHAPVRMGLWEKPFWMLHEPNRQNNSSAKPASVYPIEVPQSAQNVLVTPGVRENAFGSPLLNDTCSGR